MVTVTNAGDELARGATTAELFLSVDHAYDATDVPLLARPAKFGLRPGAAKAVRFRVQAFPEVDPAAAPAGWHLVGRVNACGELPEADFIDSEQLGQSRGHQPGAPGPGRGVLNHAPRHAGRHRSWGGLRSRPRWRRSRHQAMVIHTAPTISVNDSSTSRSGSLAYGPLDNCAAAIHAKPPVGTSAITHTATIVQPVMGTGDGL